MGAFLRSAIDHADSLAFQLTLGFRGQLEIAGSPAAFEEQEPHNRVIGVVVVHLFSLTPNPSGVGRVLTVNQQKTPEFPGFCGKSVDRKID
jgi:hypothetical protein